MKKCSKCGEEKDNSEFFIRTDQPQHLSSWCKKCMRKARTEAVSVWRRKMKEELIAICGGKCADCGGEFPPFMMDFDHRDPTQKTMPLNHGKMRNREKALEELEKCDLVCANCHRMRTHRQRCSGCKWCNGAVPER